jgi:hypothetical protein
MVRYIMGTIDEHKHCKHDQIPSTKLDSLTFDSCVNFNLLKFYNTFTDTHTHTRIHAHTHTRMHICIAPSVFKI